MSQINLFHVDSRNEDGGVDRIVKAAVFEDGINDLDLDGLRALHKFLESDSERVLMFDGSHEIRWV